MELPSKSPVLLTSSIAEFLAAVSVGSDRDAIVWSTVAQLSTVRVCAPLSIRAVWGGAESFTIGRRTLCVDEDGYLVINAGREYLARSDRFAGVESLTVFFSENTQRACHAQLPCHETFAEHLRPRDGAVAQYLKNIWEARRRGVTDRDWYADQIGMLYAQMVLSDVDLQRSSAAFAPAGLCTRVELLRRVMSAADFINSNYMRAVTLDDIASAANLSKYHLARLFRALHGVSPAAYLRAKRIRAAERLIERSDTDLAVIAERSGFGSRWSMFRELRRRRGMSGQRIRESGSRVNTDAAVTPA